MKELSEMNTEYIELRVANIQKAAYILSDILKLSNFKIVDEDKVRVYDNRITTAEILKILTLNDVEVSSMGKQTESLEDYFLKMTGESMK